MCCCRLDAIRYRRGRGARFWLVQLSALQRATEGFRRKSQVSEDHRGVSARAARGRRLLEQTRASEQAERHVHPRAKTPDRGGSDTQWAENVLAVYDYTAAQILLNSVQQAHQQGPYLLSVLKRPSDAGTSAHLWEDFTGLVPELAWERIRLFTYLAAQERSWSEDSLQRFGFKLRNLIAVGGKVTPDVMKGLEKAILFKSKG